MGFYHHRKLLVQNDTSNPSNNFSMWYSCLERQILQAIILAEETTVVLQSIIGIAFPWPSQSQTYVLSGNLCLNHVARE